MGEIKYVIFVCHGNICRSPMAEFIFKQMLAKKGLAARIRVESRATSREEIWGDVGNPIYPPAAAELRRHGVPYDDGKRARQLTEEDCAACDLLVVMDDFNLRNVLAAHPSVRKKTHKLLDYTYGGDVGDPWYSGQFARAYTEITDGCEALLSAITD